MMRSKPGNINDVDLMSGGLNILIISPQPWDGVQVSKHHYATELAGLGHTIYFVNPPSFNLRMGCVEIFQSVQSERISIVNYRPIAPYFCKFHFRYLFNLCMKIQAKILVNACACIPDVVWDFDNTYNFNDLSSFRANLAIFHPVDQLVKGQDGTKNADLVIAISNSIVERLHAASAPRYVVGHGLAQIYCDYAESILSCDQTKKTRLNAVGYVGNINHFAVDHEAILDIVIRYEEVQFHFFGPVGVTENALLRELKACDNTKFYGQCTQREILEVAPKLDAWMLCYDSTKDINGGTDSHKVLEYLATGLPVVSSHLNKYAETGLLYMPSTKSNERMLELFESMRKDLVNMPALDYLKTQRKRVGYAKSRSYSARVEHISDLVLQRV